MLVLLHLGIEGVNEVDTDQKRRFESFKVTPSNDRVLCVYAPSGHNAEKQLDKWHFFQGQQNYMENKFEENENKIILGDFNHNMDKVERDYGNRAQETYSVFPIMSCQNSSWIISLRIYAKGRALFSLTSTTTIDSPAQYPGHAGSILIQKVIAIPRLIT